MMPKFQDSIETVEDYVALRQRIDRFNNDNIVDQSLNGEVWLQCTALPVSRTVMDVGACVGEWSRQALEINPDLSLHCFEPMREVQPGLVHAVGGRAFINCFAVGASAGKLPIHILGADNLPLSSLYQRRRETFGEGHQYEVDVVPLDRYCAEYQVEQIDFLKIDVEGAEVDVLAGAAGLFAAEKIMLVQFEYGRTWLDSRCQLRDVFDRFAGTNYVLAKLMPGWCDVRDEYSFDFDSFNYANWLIIHRDFLPILQG